MKKTKHLSIKINLKIIFFTIINYKASIEISAKPRRNIDTQIST